MIRSAKLREVSRIKRFVDSFEEMDTTADTFTEEYYKRVLKKGVLLVAEDEDIIGVCFGNYNKKEEWADLLGLVVKKEFRKVGIGSALVKEFEKIVTSKGIKTIDLFADKNQKGLFSSLGYKEGRMYISFRKEL